MEFEEVLNNLKLEKENNLAQECLNEIQNRQVLFHSGFEQEKKELTSLYRLRLKTAMDLNRDKFEEDVLANWKKTIDELESCSAKKLKLN
ncbi:hypothetical protein [uncultured Psychroserpens sp.]|nr:hypothetical protein [uncultured Psychroserpens sp.]